MKVIGHRGARGIAPENTLAGFERAIECGVDAVELDVWLTADGVAVLHHDPYIASVAGDRVYIARTSYAELLRLKSDLAPLDHAIRSIKHRCRIIIEIKPGVSPQPVIDIIRDRLQRGWQVGEFGVASYDPGILAAIRQAFPGMELIVNELWSVVRATRRARRLGTSRISLFEQWLYPALLRSMAQRGWRVSPFAANKHRWWQRTSYVNNPQRLRKWRPYLYGIITDYPDQYDYRHKTLSNN